MPDHREIYQKHADQYERLVAREDYQYRILPALNDIRPSDGLDVVEMGAGTGRLTCMLAPLVKTIHAFDLSPTMLDIARTKLTQIGLQNWSAEVGDHRNLPLGDKVADLSIAGWSFGHFTAWYADAWRDGISQALREMKRVLRPSGTAIILETLGTGSETPHPPSAELAAYYAWLEQELGFAHTWIRTDFKFGSLAEAEELIGFFFGETMACQVVENRWIIVPECTGIWWLHS